MKTSVALCTYNGEKFLKEQIDSILSQTVSVDEIVVCDDGSTDKTIDILNAYEEKNPDIFRIYQNEKNLRSVKNFEKAISLCENEIIFLCDQDDVWEKEKVSVFLDYFKNNNDITVLCSNGYIIDLDCKKIDRYTIWDVPKFFRDNNEPINYNEIISFISNIATGASMAIKKEFIKNIFPIPEVSGFHHDEWIAIIASYEKKIALLDDKLFSYRFHDEQQVGGVFVKKNNFYRNVLLKKFYSKEYSKNLTVKLSFLKRLKRREKKLKQVYALTNNKIINKILSKINLKRNEITLQLKSQNIVVYFFYKVLGKI